MSDQLKSAAVFFQGYPGSGKSTAAASIAKSDIHSPYSEIHHFSIGTHLRSIISGDIPSQFADQVKVKSSVLSKSQRLNDNLVNAVVDEYLGTLGNSRLVLIDGYPLYTEQVPALELNFKKRSLDILGVLIFELPESVAQSRIVIRGTRSSEDEASDEFAWRRIHDHRTDCLGTTALLSSLHVTKVVDGSQDKLVVIENTITALHELTEKSSLI